MACSLLEPLSHPSLRYLMRAISPGRHIPTSLALPLPPALCLGLWLMGRFR